MDIYGESSSKIDFTEKYSDLFSANEGEATIVSVPKLSYITTSGVGYPTVNKEEFVEAKRFLGGIAFSIKFRLKSIGHEQFQDYSMPPIQAQWSNTKDEKGKWGWTLHLLQPSTITKEIVKKSIAVAKMKQQDTILPSVELVSQKWGQCIQTLHVGSYKTIDDTLKFLQEESEKQGYKILGEHHEIYLNDLRRTSEKNLHTIVRYKIDKK